MRNLVNETIGVKSIILRYYETETSGNPYVPVNSRPRVRIDIADEYAVDAIAKWFNELIKSNFQVSFVERAKFNEV